MIVRQENRYLIDGPITLDNVANLISECAAFEGNDVTIDLAGVTGADSSALSLLLEWTRRLGDRRITFANVNDNLRSLAELYGIAHLISPAAD